MDSFCTFVPALFRISYFGAAQNPKETPYVLLALLLFALPSELTLQKLLLLLTFGDRSHQFVADIQSMPYVSQGRFLNRFRSDSITPLMSFCDFETNGSQVFKISALVFPLAEPSNRKV